MATIAYIFMTAEDNDTTEQKSIIRDYAEKNGLRIDNYITVDVPSVRHERNRRIHELFSNVNRWDVVVVSDVALVGQNTSEIVTLVKGFSERGVRFVAAMQDLDLNGTGNASSKATVAVFKMLAELESKFASARIKKALALKKEEGAILGRPKGSISSSKLDDRKELIIDYLSKGVSKTSLARILDTSPSNLLSYLRTRNITTAKETRPPSETIPENISSEKTTENEQVEQDKPPKTTEKKQDKPPKTTEKNVVRANHMDDVSDVILCRHCGKNVLDPRTTTCAGGYIDYQDGESFRRTPYPDNVKERCPKCGVSPGGFHHDGCYIERCPRCGERLVSCACRKL